MNLNFDVNNVLKVLFFLLNVTFGFLLCFLRELSRIRKYTWVFNKEDTLYFAMKIAGLAAHQSLDTCMYRLWISDVLVKPKSNFKKVEFTNILRVKTSQ